MKLIATHEEMENGFKVTLEWSRPKVDNSRFETICLLVGIFIVGSGLLKFFSLVAG